jgi:large subunit ribosomal protein L18
MQLKKSSRREKIRYRIRKRIIGTAERPRLSVFRSNTSIYAQLIDDENGHTLLSVTSRQFKDFKGKKVDASKLVGTEVAKQATEKGISTVVFDRGGYLYHGRVKAIAEGAREGGLKF